MSERRDDDNGIDDFKNAGNSDDSHDENGGLFSDEELEAALAGFEKEFADDPDGKSASDHGNSGGAIGPDDSNVAGKASDNEGSDSVGSNNVNGQANFADSGMSDASPDTEQSDRNITDELDKMDFDEELEGLIGNRAKVAVLITRLISADLLAAFCQIADISADCVADENGAVAILHNLDGDAPEWAAKDLTSVVNGMPAVLSVNRADKLVSTLYMSGEPGQQFAPPVLFTTTPRCVEDLMLGITDVAGLKEQGQHVVSTADFDRKKALHVIAEHTRMRGRGKPSIE